MTFNNPFFITAGIILSALILIGIIVIIIMKVKKAPENARAIAGVSTVFVGLLFAGMLVYVVSTSMMYDLVNKKTYKSFELSDGNSTKTIIIKEYSSADETGFEIYADKDTVIGEVKTDSFLPFSDEEYQLDWKDDTVTIYFTYKNGEDGYVCKCVKADLSSKTVSESSDSDKDLSKKAGQSSAEESSS